MTTQKAISTVSLGAQELNSELDTITNQWREELTSLSNRLLVRSVERRNLIETVVKYFLDTNPTAVFKPVRFPGWWCINLWFLVESITDPSTKEAWRSIQPYFNSLRELGCEPKIGLKAEYIKDDPT